MFKITRDTDPKTIMFEGRPDIEITQLSNRILAACATPGELYVSFMNDAGHFNSRAFRADGTLASGNISRNLPADRIVSRLAFDPTKPLIGTGSFGPHRYLLVSTITFADGSETRYRVYREDHQPSQYLEIYASTGKVCNPNNGGSALIFSNGPIIEKRKATIFGYAVVMTMTDGVATAVELV